MDLEFLRPALKYIPEIKRPTRVVPFKEKLMWTVLVLGLFFVMGVVYPYGVKPEDIAKIPGFEVMQVVFASHLGSIISMGIGPIVTASIILQLSVGAKLINIDLSRNEGKALFQGTQKILVVIVSFFEAATFVTVFKMSASMFWVVTFQIAVGSILLMFLDEIVSKWGIGSGIGLFIAGGVSQTILNASISFVESAPGTFAGAIPNFIAKSFTGNLDLLILFPILGTIIVFLVVVYGESMRLEIPLSYGRMRGVSGRYPIKFFYVSNIPVILAAALMGSMQLLPSLVGVDYTNMSNMNVVQSAVYFFVNIATPGIGGNSLYGVLDPKNIHQMLDPFVILHLIVYSALFLIFCILFGKFWVQTTNLGVDKVAEQIHNGGMQIPGFRRDKRIIERVLERYIPQITIISSVAVGLLALGADLLGAFGTGTGILLTVGILFRMYEQIQKEEMADMPVWFRALMGKKE